MPTRTEVVISIGEVLECLPPGKSFRRKRYNSFDANQALDLEAGNLENVAPLCAAAAARCDSALLGMKSRENGVQDSELEPKVLTIRRKTRGSEDGSRKMSSDQPDEDDDEVTFNPETVSAFAENGAGLANGTDDSGAKPKNKRKSSAEKFLEDNASYFQLEVLPAKTRSSKVFECNGEPEPDTSELAQPSVPASKVDEPADYHNSFLDFLKSKRARGKDDMDDEDETNNGERSRKMAGPTDEEARGKARRRVPSACLNQSPSRSDSEDSFRPPRSRSQMSRARSRNRVRSRSNDFSASESETDTEKVCSKRKRSKIALKCAESSDDESASEGSVTKSTRSRSTAELAASPSPGKRSRRSELDKLLEAVDTSFHFETAAAAAKRMSGSQELGPLEIDVSDSNMDSADEDDVSSAVAVDRMTPTPTIQSPAKKKEASDRLKSEEKKKRKHCGSETPEEEGKRKRKKKVNSGNLLKTYSPRASKKITKDVDSEEEVDEVANVWDGWESLNETLAAIDGNPVELENLHFSFEVAPHRESWFQTYSRQDQGEDIVFYPESKTFPFCLPYELPYSTFMPHKPEVKIEEKTKKKTGKAQEELPETARKGKRKKVSECESTDSENNKKGKTKFGPKTEHLLDLQPRVSPRCHASTKAILHGGPLTDEELAEALLIQDERDLHFASFSFLSQDETSNDSMSSANTKHLKRENLHDYLQIQTSMERFLRTTQDSADVESGTTSSPTSSLTACGASAKDKSDKVTVPTRSRISSAELLKNMKDKGKKKREKTNNAELIIDEYVADNVDAILLDCLEEELPTIPFDSVSETLSLLDTYQSCNSMNVCNSRWLRPSRPSILGNSSDGQRMMKKSAIPFKPKRLVIYKEDLPGFKYDNDIEAEKLPVSKRILAKSAKRGDSEEVEATTPTTTKKETLKAVKKVAKKEVFIARKSKPDCKVEPAKPTNPKMTDIEKAESDADNVSESSTSSSVARKKLKKKLNKTGFPSQKKKNKLAVKTEQVLKKKKPKEDLKKKPDSSHSPRSPATTSRPKLSKSSKKVKLDKFVTKSKNSKCSKLSTVQRAPASHLGRRSTTLKSKNYSELESDTESLFEAKVPYRSPHIKSLMKQKGVSSKQKSSKRKST